MASLAKMMLINKPFRIYVVRSNLNTSKLPRLSLTDIIFNLFKNCRSLANKNAFLIVKFWLEPALPIISTTYYGEIIIFGLNKCGVLIREGFASMIRKRTRILDVEKYRIDKSLSLKC
jgi:hypothetical protein